MKVNLKYCNHKKHHHFKGHKKGATKALGLNNGLKGIRSRPASAAFPVHEQIETEKE